MEQVEDNIIELDINEGMRFPDLIEFDRHFAKVCKEKYVQYFKKDARTIESARAKKITRSLKADLKYYSVRWCCIHGGRQFKHRGKGIRKVHTLRKENLCPAHIHLIISDSGDDFVVSSVNNHHNHIVSESLYMHLPHNRRLPEDIRADIRKLLQMKANKHMIRTNLENELDKSITLKQLRNLQHECRKSHHNLQIVSEKIQSIFNADCHLFVDANDVFKGLFFASKEMMDALAAYPEIIFIDATYKLLAIKAPVYIILNIDGNGESTIVGISILLSEDKESLGWFLETFKKMNLAIINQIKNIMTDKDITEREVLRTCFPDASLHICVFHVLQIFRREITCDKFKFSSSTKDMILEWLQNLVYSKSYEEFYNLLQKIETKSGRVVDYLRDNWIPIREEWCPYLGSKNKNFMNITNNRLEGLNARLKTVIDKHSSLEEFIDKLAIIYKSLENEKNARAANNLNKRTQTCYKPDEFEYKYFQILTPYAFEKIKSQFSFNSIQFSTHKSKQFYTVEEHRQHLKTTVGSCDCYFSNSMGLPCKHILMIRNQLSEDLFDCELVLERWKMSYFLQHSSFIQQETTLKRSGLPDTNIVVDILAEEKKKKPLTSQEKYRKTFVKAKLLASLASDVCGTDYININNCLDFLISNLQNGKYDIFNAVSNQANTVNNVNIDYCSSLEPVNESSTSQAVVSYQNICNNKGKETACEGGTSTSNLDEDIADDLFLIINLPSTSQKVSNQNIKETSYENACVNEETTGDPNNIKTIQNDENNGDSLIQENGNNCIEVEIIDDQNICENNLDLSKIQIPNAKKRGRPAGSDITVIGLNKRRKKKKSVREFTKKTVKEKRDIILGWILPNNHIFESRQIQIPDLLPLEEIDLRITEVNINSVRKYFQSSCWELLKQHRNYLKNNATWVCIICKDQIAEYDPSIRCDVCLHWLHLGCKGEQQSLSNVFICSKCCI